MTDSTVMDETDDLPRALTVPQSLAVGIARAEIDQQITTARAYPRSLKQVGDRVFSLATLDRESAEESMYALPRGGKPITGPSIRFAEIVKQAYGNCRAAARVVHVDREEKFVEAEGIFHDLETNVATTARVRRRIVDSKGRLYSDDMIIVTGNAACSIALRNAIMGGVPKPLWRRAYEAVQATIKGDVTTLTENRTKALQAFAVYGVKPEQVFGALEVRGIEDVTVEHLPLLRGMFAALKNGEATVEEMFGAATAPGTAPQQLHAGFEDKPKEERASRAKRAAPAKPTAEQAQRTEELQKTQAGGDVLDGDDIPAEGGARPTGTAGVPAAESGPATSETATDASTAGQAGSTSQQGSSEPTDDGEQTDEPEESEIDRINREARERAAATASDVIAEGFPAPDEIYHLDGDTWGENGRRETYKNGQPFSSVTRKAGLPIYADHAPAPGESDAQEDDGGFPPEFQEYIDAIESAPTFADVKRAMQKFYNTDLFKSFAPDQQNKVRADTWGSLLERKIPLPDHASDVSAFRLWIEHEEDADAIQGTLRALELDEGFKAKEPSFKQAIRQAVANRIDHLGA